MIIDGESRSRRKKILAVAGAATAVLVALVLVFLKMTPQVYTRTAAMGLDPAAAGRFDEQVINQVGNVLLDKSGGTPLDLVMTEEMVNARLAQALADEVREGRAVPSALRDMRVGFEPGRLVLATRLGDGLSSVVVSQGFKLSATEDGRLLVEPAGTAGGLLPLPGGLMDFVKPLADQAARREADDTDVGTAQVWRPVLEGVLDGKPVPLGKGKKRIVVEKVEIERGVLRVQGHRIMP